MKSFIKLLPIVVMAGMVTTGIDILISASIGFFFAMILCMIFEKMKINDVIMEGYQSAREGVQMAFILMMAYALAEIFMSTGVGAAAIELFINIGVTGRSVATIAFLTTCVLSVSTGTSWGTFAACIPIFIWLCDVVGGHPGMVMAACIGGSAFGDNIGLISDTTILSSALQNVKVVDRVRTQAPWSILCLVISAILFYIVSISMGLPTTVGDPSQILASMSPETIAALEAERPAVLTLLDQVKTHMPIYLLIPVVVVITMAILRFDTLICLASGIVLSVIFGAIAGTVTSAKVAMDMVYTGFSDAGSWCVIMLFWAMGFGGIMRRMNAFQPISIFFVRISRRVRHLITCNGLLCLFINGTVNEDLSQMACAGPVIRGIVNDNVEGSEENLYRLRIRNALFSDAIGVHTSSLIPWHVGALYYMGLTIAVYPLYEFKIADLYYNYMGLISVVSIYLLTFTGWDRFVPWFSLPTEPDVRLKKDRVVTGSLAGVAEDTLQ